MNYLYRLLSIILVALSFFSFESHATQAADHLKENAVSGNPDAQVAYAQAILDKTADTQNPWHAALFLEMAALNGHPDAHRSLYQLLDGTLLPLKPDFNPLSAYDSPTAVKALLRIGGMYLDGVRQYGKLPDDVDKEALKTDPYGTMLNMGLVHVKKDFDRAQFIYARLHEHGVALGTFYLGVTHLKEDGEKYDPQKALKYFKQAAKKGVPQALYNVGWIYENVYSSPDNMQKAARLYQASLAKSVPVAQYRLGRMYADGRGVSKDLRKALDHYKKAEKMSPDKEHQSRGFIWGQAALKRIRLEQYIESKVKKRPFSNEGLMFHKQGSPNALFRPASRIIGIMSAKLKFCNKRALHDAFQKKVVYHLNKARSDKAKDAIKKRIRAAFAKETHRLDTALGAQWCAIETDKTHINYALALMYYDWGFETDVNGEIAIPLFGDVYVVGGQNDGFERDKKLAPYISKIPEPK